MIASKNDQASSANFWLQRVLERNYEKKGVEWRGSSEGRGVEDMHDSAGRGEAMGDESTLEDTDSSAPLPLVRRELESLTSSPNLLHFSSPLPLPRCTHALPTRQIPLLPLSPHRPTPSSLTSSMVPNDHRGFALSSILRLAAESMANSN
eukprot:756726-Hanusia_phi.AAC.1